MLLEYSIVMPRRGRPPIPPPERRSKRIQVLVTPAVHRRLRAMAQAQDRSVSQTVGALLDRALARADQTTQGPRA